MNVIEARQAAFAGKLKKFNDDIKNLTSKIEEYSKEGLFSLDYDAQCGDRLNLLIEHFRNQGFKVRRYVLFHSGYNTIKVSW